MKNGKTKSVTPNFNSQEFYLNRELSLLEFNRRVIHEALCEQHPLLERLKLNEILNSNLDEFFLIRVEGIKSQIAAGVL